MKLGATIRTNDYVSQTSTEPFECNRPAQTEGSLQRIHAPLQSYSYCQTQGSMERTKLGATTSTHSKNTSSSSILLVLSNPGQHGADEAGSNNKHTVRIQAPLQSSPYCQTHTHLFNPTTTVKPKAAQSGRSWEQQRWETKDN